MDLWISLTKHAYRVWKAPNFLTNCVVCASKHIMKKSFLKSTTYVNNKENAHMKIYHRNWFKKRAYMVGLEFFETIYDHHLDIHTM